MLTSQKKQINSLKISLKNLWVYIKYPTISKSEQNWKILNRIPFFKIFLLTAVIGFLLTPFDIFASLSFLKSFFGIRGHIIQNAFEKSVFKTLILVLIVAPIVEEVLFRFPLKWPVLFPIYILWLIDITFSLWDKSFFENKILVSILFILLILFYFFFAFDKYAKWMNTSFIKLYRWFYYLTVIIFGLSHIFNYEMAAHKPLSVILVLPQILSGFYFGYIRMKYNIFASIFAHFCVNFQAICFATCYVLIKRVSV